jgi:hypothetical protein
MIRITCPNCGSKLDAKDELVGQTRKCPKCAQPLQIVADSAADGIALDEPPSDQHVQVSADKGLPVVDLPNRLNRESHYLICDKNRVVAMWENNGGGWMVRGGAGFLSARRNRDNLPAEGDFKLIELKFTMTPDGKRLSGLASYQLVTRWALNVLDQGDDLIFEKITGLGCLNRDQKNAVRQALRDQFMRPVWQDAADVLDYLGNADYHSPGVGL